jgi:hypothetical protein
MGGSGSGRDGYRPVIEYGLKLDSYNLQRKGLLSTRSKGIVPSSLTWTNTTTGEKVASIGYEVNYSIDRMTLDYTCTVGGEKHQVKESVWLSRHKTNFGGSRFLFLCPGCSKRTAKLYLPSGGIYFRCRRCYNLTYLSSNESHAGDALFAHIASEVGLPFSQVKRMLKPR